MGSDVPRASRRRKEDVFVCKADDRQPNKKADNPKPDKTIPVVVALALSGKLFAVALTEPDRPPPPPAPVIKVQNTRSQNLIGDNDPEDEALLSKIYRIPEYPTRRKTNAPAKR
jgi:hypothetical protein